MAWTRKRTVVRERYTTSAAQGIENASDWAEPEKKKGTPNSEPTTAWTRQLPRRDPIGTTLLVTAVAMGLVAVGSWGLVPAAAAVGIGILLFRLGTGEYTAFRLFGCALLVRNAGLLVVSVLAGGPSSPIFPDEAQYAKITLEAASLIFGKHYPALPSQIASMAGPDGLRRFSDDGFAYLLSPLAAVTGPNGTLAALRGATALCGALAIVALWWAGSKLAGRRAGRRAGIAYVFFPTSIFWSATALKEAAVSALVLLSLGMIALLSTEPRRLWLRWVPLLWVAWFVLLSIREHLAFVAAGTSLVGAFALRWHSDKSSFTGGLSKRFASSIPRVATVLVVASTALWASGYGFLGKDVFHSLDPAFLEQRVQMETKGGTQISPASPEPTATQELGNKDVPDAKAKPGSPSGKSRGEASSPRESSTSPESRLRRLLARLPKAALAVVLRPYPWETPQGALSHFAGASRAFVFPAQLLWYAMVVLGLLGAWRIARRHFAHALTLLSFPTVVLFFYGLTQANLGTSFRLREVFVPLVLLVAAVPLRPRLRHREGSFFMLLPTAGPGGTESHVIEVARCLRERGRSVRVIVLRDLPLESAKYIPSLIRQDVLWSARRKSRYDITLPIRLARKMKNPQCISTYLFAGNFWGGLAARLSGAPLVSNVRTTHPRSFPQRKTEPLVAGEVVLCNSKATASSAAKRGMPPGRINILPNGVDAKAVRASVSKDRSEVLSSLGIPPSSFVLCCPARFDPLKDQLTAVEGFRLSSLSNRADAYLVLAGSAQLPTERKYKEIVAKAAADLERVLLIDFYHPGAELLAASDAVILSSVHEGMPNVLLEAGALAKPAIATTAGGASEVIVDGETGILVEPKNPHALAAALDSLASDKESRKRMGLAAQRRIEEVFSIEAEIEGLERIISKCLRTAEEWDQPEAGRYQA
ncbi:MAG: hypothetical protein C4318_00475 [Acidimicrobiia bacterium]